MRLVSYNQLFDMLGTNNSFDRSVKRFFDDDRHHARSFPIRMDMVREKDAFVILAELPGMEKDRIKVMVEEGILTISGDRNRAKDDDQQIVRSEMFYGSFTRSFKLPDKIEKSGISADYKNGLLEVTLPVKAEEKPKQINVNVN